MPIGAYSQQQPGGKLQLTAMVGRPDGSLLLRENAEGRDPEQLGRETAQKLLSRGADQILRDVYAQEAPATAHP